MALIIGLILGAAAVIFVLQNFEPVTVNFLSWSIDGSLAMVILVALVGGILISTLLSLPEMLRLDALASRNRELRRELERHKEALATTEGRLAQTGNKMVVEKTIFVDKRA